MLHAATATDEAKKETEGCIKAGESASAARGRGSRCIIGLLVLGSSSFLLKHYFLNLFKRFARFYCIVKISSYFVHLPTGEGRLYLFAPENYST